MKLNEYQQKALMQSFKNGDEAAFNKIFNLFYLNLWYFATRLIRHSEDAKDIVIICLNYVFARHKDFEKLESLKAYLIFMIKSKCIKYSQAKVWMTDSVPDVINEEYADAEIVRTEYLKLIFDEIDQLPGLQKSTFKLFYLESKSLKEISIILNTSAETVTTAKQRAVKKLRASLILKGYDITTFIL